MVCYGNVVGWMLLPQAVFDDYICQLDDDVLLPKILKTKNVSNTPKSILQKCSLTYLN